MRYLLGQVTSAGCCYAVGKASRCYAAELEHGVMGHSVLLLSRYDRMGPSSRVRHYNYVPALERAGFDVTIAPFLDGDYLRRLYRGEGRSRQP